MAERALAVGREAAVDADVVVGDWYVVGMVGGCAERALQVGMV